MARRRRAVQLAAAACAVLVLGGCSAGSSRSPATTTTAPAVASTIPPSTCALGGVPDGGEVTYVREGQFLGATADGGQVRCLAATATDAASPQWNGLGDRVLFDDSLVLSRPTGKSVLRVADGRLFKRPVDGGPESDISFLDHTDAAIYHPRGEHIVAVGRRDGVFGIYVATNLGQGPKLVTRGEDAQSISDLAWTASGALVFVAHHGYSDSHLHRLQFPSLRLTTVATVSRAVRGVAASRFEGAGLAWTESADDGRPCSLRINRGGKVVTPPRSVEASVPVGWLPGGVLVLRADCGRRPGVVRTLDLSADPPVVHDVTDGALGVGVRALLPVGPGLELDDVVESQAPA